MNPYLRTDGAPLAIGHRGASAVAPENTMAAFRACWEGGARWVEADVQPSADGVPFILHDDTVDRTTDGTGVLRAMTAQAAAGLDAGGWFAPEFAGATIPRLTELLAALGPDRRLLLEIKGEHGLEQVRTVLGLLADSGHEAQVFLESFELPALRHVHTIDPDRGVGLLVEQVHADPVAACAEVGAIAYNPPTDAVLARPEIVGALHGAGIAVQVWPYGHNSDDPAEWGPLTDLGVDGIITNDPAALVRWQQRR